jgi:hypothetical protein
MTLIYLTTIAILTILWINARDHAMRVEKDNGELRERNCDLRYQLNAVGRAERFEYLEQNWSEQ